jgi:hypothetical protein
MKSAVCTLFEGDYHYGVGALANSLYAGGFRGILYVGYRGALPPWVGNVSANCKPTEYTPAEGLTLRFISLNVRVHLANYKPDFMLKLFQEHCPDADALFYFDPDIIVKCRWIFFREWVNAGVALCTDINPSMPINHPIRFGWKQLCAKHGFTVKRELDTYFNSGFLGLRRNHADFLRNWQRTMELTRSVVGDLDRIKVPDEKFLFCSMDQDAMNIACMISEDEISPMGQDGMDLQSGGGGYIMSHAVGATKPWRKAYARTAILRGLAPSRADRQYFKHLKYPIRLYSATSLACKLFDLKLASALGRFVRAN